MKSASLESVVHPCGEEPGSIVFSVQGQGEGYTYYWTDGATGPVRTGLGPGIYTFVVRDPYGCEESCDVELLGGVSCELSYDVLTDVKYCEATIVLHLTDAVSGLDLSGNPNVVVSWDDGDPSGLVRTVTGEPGSIVCYGVSVSISGEDGQSCCSQYLSCIVVSFGNCNVGSSVKKIIVNETQRSSDGKYQFAELLVIGDGYCGDSMDLRGYIVDDNNGSLIRPNAFVNEWNTSEIGIDAGYLVFSKADAWSAVPAGSLLVLYGDRADMPPDFPADDPWDSDADGVYVLSVAEAGAFEGRSAAWSGDLSAMKYDPAEDEAVLPVWDLLQLSAPADGMQVRDSSGELVHGISSGESAFALEGAYELWLGVASMSDLNCRFIGTDWKSPLDFSSLSANAGLASPGLPNSAANDSLIQYLRSCDTSAVVLLLAGHETGEVSTAAVGRSAAKRHLASPVPEAVSPGVIASSNEVRVWPNPYKRELNVLVKSGQTGMLSLRIWTVNGVLLQEQQFFLEKGSGQFRIKAAAGLPRQLLFMEVRFADGERRMLKVVHE